ncbi:MULTISPECIES: tripartite tricarboxylate transporter substrate binding protein [unclassified Polaromonas]|jgi:tripartite-type tricarboxylate transporter receptor subunit TctC|uniref:Bug family tripartite tricarboxylate transporter substrate binding protein n=1 Tax=unclassified Polaromonas TaxID=2638319 RepID=UPI000BCF5B0B|nr:MULTISPECIES: tripartite tricarboxylate transporter substrate binding protein [unclassified Polaromonas]OYY35003.1 MAG: ABC transporter substrate-binding protein [Polaromonas sp. 35-63-35]OYZ20143.1 MAG: ABC transporter substrate-binding protein [Polaromonas sp. 16-63-31]OYZ77897.1 MAG: ABC transporter substrate-binding protein [Polaromonas sp. 24-63-21]OZA49406.1 MAG: ABC transporter substrate-binding protein [Polaromonas sp. 17-63-33]OZA87460.1 MAG: ABC transporter substrate-binding prote
MTSSFDINASRRNVLRAAAAGVAAFSLGSHAQSGWPAKPVTMIVPFPAGGGTDAFARPMSAQFARLTGKQMIIDNRGGAGGTLGASIAAKAPADGYTLFMGAVHHTIAPSMYPRLDYDIEKDLVPLILVASVPQVVVVNPQKLQVANFKEFLDNARKNPGKLNYGSAGAGTSHHLAGELFKQQTKTFITHIPYRGAGPALQGLIAGDVEMMFDGLGSSASHIAGGRIKALMVSGNKRNPAIPDVPSATEMGLPDYNVTTWYGVWGPKGMPADAQARAIEEIRKACTTDEAKAVWARQGAEFTGLSGPQFGSFISAEVKKWAQVVKASGAKLD